MGSTLSRVATTIVAGLLLVGCTAAPTPSPSTIPTPSGLPPTIAPTPSSPPTASPAPIALATGQLAAGYAHSCVVTGGPVKCWGANNDGQLGNGTINETPVPGVVDVVGLAGGIRAIAAGAFHTCALTSAGGVKCWGDNLYGQLGDGMGADRSTPADVVGLSSGVTAISLGWSHSCALTSAGGVKCWGNNPFGGLGDGTRSDRGVPVDVVGLTSGINAIAAGGGHTCALTSGGGVVCWGDGQSDDPAVFHTSVPVDVPNMASGIAAISAGQDRTCALTKDGGVRCWGPNYAAPQGETLPDRLVALDVSGLAGGVAAVALAESYPCVLSNAGGVACWDASNVPVAVPGLASEARALAVGGMHACALVDGGGIRCWGSNENAQLGGVMRCSTTSVALDVPFDGGALKPPSSEPIGPGRIEHATGPTDVVLRFDRGPDVAVGDLVGELFQPGPEFTLYGDGTVIFRNEMAPPPPAEGPIIRGRPFMAGRLDDGQVQSLLRFAVEEGGLGDACERYETTDLDGATVDVFTIRAGGIDKRIENFGSAPFAALYDRIRDFESESGVPTEVWVPERYRGNLLDASIFAFIGDGQTPGLAEYGSVPWPWPDVAPADFVGLAELNPGRRVMSAAEAAALALSANGGVVQRIYLRGPDGEALYYFSLWPMSPDETT
jgi:hypothetical protein